MIRKLSLEGKLEGEVRLEVLRTPVGQQAVGMFWWVTDLDVPRTELFLWPISTVLTSTYVCFHRKENRVSGRTTTTGCL